MSEQYLECDKIKEKNKSNLHSTFKSPGSLASTFSFNSPLRQILSVLYLNNVET